MIFAVFRNAESRCVPPMPSPFRLGLSGRLGRSGPSDCRAAGGRRLLRLLSLLAAPRHTEPTILHPLSAHPSPDHLLPRPHST